jgi:TonB family protein
VKIAEFSGEWEGRTIDSSFPLRQFLGAGESSAVFLTTYQTRPAAIKLVHTEPQSADAQLSRWRAASKLSHPNLIKIFNTGRCELDGMALLYVVMEHADENLSQVLLERPLTTSETRAMLEPTLAALDYLHRQGFIHAHLKPSNIMAVDDQVKISSDGLCRQGTTCLNPPTAYDRADRAKGDISPATDIWSLGMTLVEVLTQHLPEGGRVPADLPEPFAAIASHCLDRNAADRWTIAQISLRLGIPSPVAVSKRRYIPPVGVMILLGLLIVLVVGVIVKYSDIGAAAPAVSSAVSKEAPREVPKGDPRPIPTTTATSEPAKTVAPVKPPPATQAPEPDPPQQSAPLDPAQPMPEVTDQARRTIHGRVVVDVTADVDPSGAVTDAKLDHSGSKFFGKSALKAIRQWKFKPVAVDGRETAQQWRVRFEFRSTGTKVEPQRLSP